MEKMVQQVRIVDEIAQQISRRQKTNARVHTTKTGKWLLIHSMHGRPQVRRLQSVPVNTDMMGEDEKIRESNWKYYYKQKIHFHCESNGYRMHITHENIKAFF